MSEKIKHICIITSRYPTEVDKTALTFVQQFAWAVSSRIQKVSVICPLPTNLNKKFRSLPLQTTETTPDGKTINIYMPRYVSFGQRGIGCLNTARITTSFFTKAVKNVLCSFSELPDVLYGHFITPAGLTACRLGKKYGISSFVAYGESSTWSINHIGKKRVAKELANVNGIISVSTQNKQELLGAKVVSEDKIGVFPNGYMASRFSPREQVLARQRFKIPQNNFVVGFVGHFIERKGIEELKSAVDSIPEVYMICAGKGVLKPTGERVLYAEPVDPDELALFYGAADIFVLPTKNEGCCNAIIEAMACGLPIISADRSFNDDILDETNSLRIDPTDVNAIATAIKILRDDVNLRNQLAQGSLEKSKELTLEKRVEKIISFMEKMK